MRKVRYRGIVKNAAQVFALLDGDGQHARLLKSLARVELLILNDLGLSPMLAGNAATSWRSWRTATAAAPPS